MKWNGNTALVTVVRNARAGKLCYITLARKFVMITSVPETISTMISMENRIGSKSQLLSGIAINGPLVGFSSASSTPANA
jgi:hypothetical protein